MLDTPTSPDLAGQDTASARRYSSGGRCGEPIFTRSKTAKLWLPLRNFRQPFASVASSMWMIASSILPFFVRVERVVLVHGERRPELRSLGVTGSCGGTPPRGRSGRRWIPPAWAAPWRGRRRRRSARKFVDGGELRFRFLIGVEVLLTPGAFPAAALPRPRLHDATRSRCSTARFRRARRRSRRQKAILVEEAALLWREPQGLLFLHNHWRNPCPFAAIEPPMGRRGACCRCSGTPLSMLRDGGPRRKRGGTRNSAATRCGALGGETGFRAAEANASAILPHPPTHSFTRGVARPRRRAPGPVRRTGFAAFAAGSAGGGITSGSTTGVRGAERANCSNVSPSHTSSSSRRSTSAGYAAASLFRMARARAVGRAGSYRTSWRTSSDTWRPAPFVQLHRPTTSLMPKSQTMAVAMDSPLAGRRGRRWRHPRNRAPPPPCRQG